MKKGEISNKSQQFRENKRSQLWSKKATVVTNFEFVAATDS
jgi:hypothetical protein